MQLLCNSPFSFSEEIKAGETSHVNKLFIKFPLVLSGLNDGFVFLGPIKLVPIIHLNSESSHVTKSPTAGYPVESNS